MRPPIRPSTPRTYTPVVPTADALRIFDCLSFISYENPCKSSLRKQHVEKYRTRKRIPRSASFCGSFLFDRCPDEQWRESPKDALDTMVLTAFDLGVCEGYEQVLETEPSQLRSPYSPDSQPVAVFLGWESVRFCCLALVLHFIPTLTVICAAVLTFCPPCDTKNNLRYSPIASCRTE